MTSFDPMNRIRRFLADRRAAKSRDRHVKMLNAKKAAQRKRHGPTRHIDQQAYDFTHDALRGRG